MSHLRKESMMRSIVVFNIAFLMSKHCGVEIEALSTLCLLILLKSGIIIIHINMHRFLQNMLGVRMVWYAAYWKFSIPVKALPKLVLYGKHGTQRVVAR